MGPGLVGEWGRYVAGRNWVREWRKIWVHCGLIVVLFEQRRILDRCFFS